MATCVVPQNQPIYQALIDKAASYPADKIYQSKAWKIAADSVAEADRNLYTEGRVYQLNGVGVRIEDFINKFIDNHPVTTQPAQPVASLYTPENPRRSGRNTNKSKIVYYSPEDEMMDVEDAIIAVCEKKGLTYSEELLTEFYDYLKTAYKYKTIIENATIWAKYYSTSLRQQESDIENMKAIDKYCTKNGMVYDANSILTKYYEWKSDPVNDKLVNVTSMTEKYKYSYPKSTSTRVKNFFKSMKKQIVY